MQRSQKTTGSTLTSAILNSQTVGEQGVEHWERCGKLFFLSPLLLFARGVRQWQQGVR